MSDATQAKRAQAMMTALARGERRDTAEMTEIVAAIATVEHELHRHRHGTTIEGDDVCEHELGVVELKRKLAEPIPMRLTCPECGELHVDEGEFAIRVHHTHSCQHCGLTWRPAVVPTVGVRFLPGFKSTP